MFTAYLSSVLMPSFGDKSSIRHTRELQTLAAALDQLIQGNLAGVADLLAQRFKAVEMAAQEGSWSVARHFELVGDGKVSSSSQREREQATLAERHDQRMRALSKPG